MNQSAQIRLHLQILAVLGSQKTMSVLDIAHGLYVDRAEDELPTATIELAVRDLCGMAIVRRCWVPRRRHYTLTRYGRRLHQDVVDACATGTHRHCYTNSIFDGLLP